MFSIFWLLIFCLIFCTSVSDDSSISSFIVFVERSFDNIKKYLYSWFEIIAKIGIPSPHNFKGSNYPFCNCWHEFRRYNQVGLADQKCQVWSSWCMMVCVWKQEYAAWGSVFTIIDKTFISFMSWSILFWTYSRLYLEEPMTAPKWHWPWVVILTVNARCLAFSFTINHDFNASG